MTHVPVLALVTYLALIPTSAAVAQVRDTTMRNVASGATISGVVNDSVARQPLAGATVQLVDADSLSRFVRTVVSDTRGRFNFAAVPEGRYILGFLHERLDNLGLEPRLHMIQVERERAVRADLAIPSPATIRSAVCGSHAAGGSGVVMGVVRDPDGAPAPGVAVVAEWLELDVSAVEGVTTRRPRIADTSRDNGWFVLCNVPSPGELWLVARRSADSTDRLRVMVTHDGLARHDLYVGSTRTDGPTRPLGGSVTAIQGGRPVANALVSVAGVQTRTNERGEWAIPDAPSGTRRLEVRAVGYYPEDRVVDVIAGAPPIGVALFTMRAMLDTIKISATRLSPNMVGFEQRRTSSPGRYITPEFIARRRVHNTTELFRMEPGMFVEKLESLGPTMLTMRGTFADRCIPQFFLNGSYAGVLTGDELDAFVSPEEVAGIEIYREPAVPAQFIPGSGGGCGSIVVWTRAALGARSRMSMQKRMLIVTGIVAGIWAFTELVFAR